ncbi:MAG: hypothetical protein ACXW4U_18350, partial [Anaerolineales bacterium]
SFELSFQLKDLSKSRPGGIGIEHFTGGNRSNLYPSISFVYCFFSQEVCWDLSKAWHCRSLTDLVFFASNFHLGDGFSLLHYRGWERDCEETG